ncbi:MAG: EAL domain-containing response regulator [Leptolyngbyaceae bacterium]|nr:EAL domain-containing response regulator [Leptolyngbyaceae bacterium]
MSKTILVIEDEIYVRDLLIDLLENDDFQVFSAENGSNGLHLAGKYVPDLIICDVVMQGLDGYEVLRRLRQNLQTAAIPVIFLTAKTERAAFRKAMVMGADDYITKPFTCDELLDAIHARLNKQAMVRQAYTIHDYLHPPAVESIRSGKPPLRIQSHLRESHLYQALEQAEFELYYQPQFAMASGILVGAEALIRWRSPQFGMVAPTEFMALAEETGFMILLDQWVIQTACAQAKTWQTTGLSPLRIAINISSLQFHHPHLMERIGQVLATTGLDPQCLEIELTESLLMQDVDRTIGRLQELKQLNVQIAIDDFGTGYASLGYLQHFPFDIIKLDQRFVRDVNRNATNAAIARAVIQMAHHLHLEVVAEGVETDGERQFLLQHQCDIIQGYLTSHPLSAKDFEQFQKTASNSPLTI